jgi:hypothetical protein
MSDGTILVAGGSDDWAGLYLTSVQLFNNGNWSTVGNIQGYAGQGRTRLHIATAQSGAVIPGGLGWNGSSYVFSNAADLYNVTAGTVAPTNNLRTRRQNMPVAALSNGEVLVPGGYNSTDGFAFHPRRIWRLPTPRICQLHRRVQGAAKPPIDSRRGPRRVALRFRERGDRGPRVQVLRSVPTIDRCR